MSFGLNFVNSNFVNSNFVNSNLVKCLVLSLILVGCSSAPKDKKRTSFTPGTVKSKIIQGVTTQTELVQLFGSPNIVSQNRSGEEVWTYSKQSASTKAKSSLWSVIFAGQSEAYSDTSSANFSLVVTFDSNDVVKNYSMVSSEF